MSMQVLGDIEIAQGIERDMEKKQKEVSGVDGRNSIDTPVPKIII